MKTKIINYPDLVAARNREVHDTVFLDAKINHFEVSISTLSLCIIVKVRIMVATQTTIFKDFLNLLIKIFKMVATLTITMALNTIF